MSVLSMEDYREFVKARSIYPGSGSLLGALYCGLKMAGESGELLEHVRLNSNKSLILKEAGDVLWYVIATERELGMALSVTKQPMQPWLREDDALDWADALVIATTRYTESLGKSMRDGGFSPGVNFDRMDEAWRQRLKDALENVLFCIAGVAHSYGKKLHQIAEMNVAKLTDRDARGVTKGDGDNR